MRPSYYLAQANYSCDAYGSNNFGECSTTAAGAGDAGGAAGSGASGGVLANTGYDVLIPLALGAAILVASVIVLVKRLRRRNA